MARSAGEGLITWTLVVMGVKMGGEQASCGLLVLDDQPTQKAATATHQQRPWQAALTRAMGPERTRSARWLILAN